jgi:hypothetical protein
MAAAGSLMDSLFDLIIRGAMESEDCANGPRGLRECIAHCGKVSQAPCHPGFRRAD